MDKTIQIVVGLGFGDEGKGKVVSRLLHEYSSWYPTSRSIVIRYCGGHNAGHGVIYDNRQRIFSSFGSGTLQNVPTYWSKYCTVYPIALANESRSLYECGIKNPQIYIHPLAPITTPLDVHYNRHQNLQTQHGTVGVGFGSTIQRHENHYKIYATDIFYDSILTEKLNGVYNYYKDLGILMDASKYVSMMESFYNSISYIKKFIHIESELMLSAYDHLVFEGSQGILLDKDHGFFPNVTRSSTTSKNAIETIINHILPYSYEQIDLIYVTRGYQTRHGNGYMSNTEHKEILNIIPNKHETNVFNVYQGEFKQTVLDMDLLKYALTIDNVVIKETVQTTSNLDIDNVLIVNCIDQIQDNLLFTENGNLYSMPTDDDVVIANGFGIFLPMMDSVRIGRSANTTNDNSLGSPVYKHKFSSDMIQPMKI